MWNSLFLSGEQYLLRMRMAISAYLCSAQSEVHLSVHMVRSYVIRSDVCDRMSGIRRMSYVIPVVRSAGL